MWRILFHESSVRQQLVLSILLLFLLSFGDMQSERNAIDLLFQRCTHTSITQVSSIVVQSCITSQAHSRNSAIVL